MTKTMPRYIFVKLVSGRIYDMWGGEPNCVGYTTTKKEAEAQWGDNYKKIELCYAGTLLPTIHNRRN